MRPETKQNLADVISAGREILQIAGLDGAAYKASRRDALAVERLFEIIGEALICIRTAEPDVLEHITGAFEVIGFRVVLAHGYDQIDVDRVVAIIESWLPRLLSDVMKLSPDLAEPH